MRPPTPPPDPPLAVGGGDALHPSPGRTGRGRRAWAALPGNAIAGSPYGQGLAAGALRSPAATFSDASRVSIGTLDLRDTSTQLTFDNTQPYNAATGQGVQLPTAVRRRQRADHRRQRRLRLPGRHHVLAHAAYQGPALSANGGQLSFLLPADAVNGTTMLRASAPIARRAPPWPCRPPAAQAPAARRPHHAHQRHHRHGRQPGSHILEYGAYRYLFDVQSASALTATLASTNLTLAANKLYPAHRRRHRRARQRRHAVGRRPARPRAARPVLQSGPGPHPLHRQEPRWTAPTPCSATPWRRHRRGDYVVAPLVEAGRPLSRPGFVGGLSAEGKGRVDNVGVGILARYWFLGGTYAEASLRSGRMRGSYTDDIDGSTNYQSFELLGPTPCWAM